MTTWQQQRHKGRKTLKMNFCKCFKSWEHKKGRGKMKKKSTKTRRYFFPSSVDLGMGTKKCGGWLEARLYRRKWENCLVSHPSPRKENVYIKNRHQRKAENCWIFLDSRGWKRGGSRITILIEALLGLVEGVYLIWRRRGGSVRKDIMWVKKRWREDKKKKCVEKGS